MIISTFDGAAFGSVAFDAAIGNSAPIVIAVYPDPSRSTSAMKPGYPSAALGVTSRKPGYPDPSLGVTRTKVL